MRLWIHLIIILFYFEAAESSLPSYHLAHPLGWMFQAPVGETPGWSTSFWIHTELSQSNVWNDEFQMEDRRNGNTLTYMSDFEQTTTVLDIGFAMDDRWSFSIETPFAARGGGVLDDFIDQFHIFVGAERFLRNQNAKYDSQFKIQTNGNSELNKLNLTGVGNIKLKTKYWLWQWRAQSPGACDCGFSFGGQVKIPLAEPRSGLTSGHTDWTLTAHLGLPIGSNSGIWATSAFTQLGRNTVLDKWPIRRYAQMYEVTFDLGGETWGFIGSLRAESPILNKNDVRYIYTTTNPTNQSIYRVASGWNSLVYWRGSQSVGFRWRNGNGTQFNFMAIEDWGVGDQDWPAENLYVNNAPDIAFGSQLLINF